MSLPIMTYWARALTCSVAVASGKILSVTSSMYFTRLESVGGLKGWFSELARASASFWSWACSSSSFCFSSFSFCLDFLQYGPKKTILMTYNHFLSHIWSEIFKSLVISLFYLHSSEFLWNKTNHLQTCRTYMHIMLTCSQQIYLHAKYWVIWDLKLL